MRQGDLGSAMPLHLERIEWMPSPPLAPDDGPIDFAHLSRMTLGDAGLEQEVLAMFSAQSAKLVNTLAAMPRSRRAGAYAEGLGSRDRRLCGRRCRGPAGAGPRQRLRPVRVARRTRRCGFAGADGDRGAPALFLRTPSISAKFPEKCPLRFSSRPLALCGSTRYRTAGTLLLYSGSTSDHGQNPLCRPFRRETHH